MGAVIHGLHVGQVDDGAVVCDKCCSQRQVGVAHPKTLNGGLLKNEQHAFVLRHLLAPHQADLALFKILCQLYLEEVHACIQRGSGQLCLGYAFGMRLGWHQVGRDQTAECECADGQL